VLTAFRNMVARVSAWCRGDQLDRDFEEELASHIEMSTADQVSRGTAPDEARRLALIRLGATRSLQEQHRAWRGLPALDSVLQDLRYALRSSARAPGFTGLVVLTLALGIGASTATFSLVDAVLLRPLPFPDSDRLGIVWEKAARFGYPKTGVSPANFVDWAAQSESFDDLAAYFGDAYNLIGQGRPERLDGMHATPNLFSLLDVRPLLGRTFLPSEGTPGNNAVVILSHALWQRKFGGDPRVIGRTTILSDQPYVIVGVMPPGFQFPGQDTQLWTPAAFSADDRSLRRDNHFLRVIGRLKRDRTWTRAQTEFDTIAARLAAAYPKTNADYQTLVVPLHEEFTRGVRSPLVFLHAGALLLLLVAWANVAGLLMTRALRRRSELALRLALGASHGRIARQLLIEGLTLSTAGGAAGVLVAVLTFRLFEIQIPSTLRGAVALGIDWRVLGFVVGASLAGGMLLGLAPLRAISSLELTRSFAARGSQVRDRSRATLVSAEIAIAMVIVASTGLLVRTIVNLQNVDPGFRAENVLTARLEMSASESSTLERRKRFYADVVERVRTLPGVVAAGFTTFLPYTNFAGSSPLALANRPDLPDGAQFAYRREITPGYLPAIGVPLLTGRWFDDNDDLNHPPVAIVNEYIANLLGEGDATGKRLKLGAADAPWLTIVGVVGNIREEGLDAPAERGTVYTPVAQSRVVWYFNPRDLAIRVAGDPSLLVAALEREVWAIDKDQTISNVRLMSAVVDRQISARKAQAAWLAAFAGLVVFLAALGVYGLMSFVVTSRTQEFGVRLALGADRIRLARLVAGQGFVSLAIGAAAGLAITLALTRTLAGLLYGVRPLDPLTLIGAAILLCGVGSAASLLPVYRATRIDPLIAMRSE
jgi:predicted permease